MSMCNQNQSEFAILHVRLDYQSEAWTQTAFRLSLIYGISKTVLCMFGLAKCDIESETCFSAHPCGPRFLSIRSWLKCCGESRHRYPALAQGQGIESVSLQRCCLSAGQHVIQTCSMAAVCKCKLSLRTRSFCCFQFYQQEKVSTRLC